MKRAILFVILSGAIAALGAASARSASPVTVGLPGCYFGNGGQATVPAGTDLSVRFTWAENNRGRTQDFLNAQTTTSNVNGAWGAIEGTAATWLAHVGILASPGDSVTVNFQISLSRAVPEGKDPDTGEHFKVGPGAVLPAGFGCTITAV